jgi:hypothetical protein
MDEAGTPAKSRSPTKDKLVAACWYLGRGDTLQGKPQWLDGISNLLDTCVFVGKSPYPVDYIVKEIHTALLMTRTPERRHPFGCIDYRV